MDIFIADVPFMNLAGDDYSSVPGGPPPSREGGESPHLWRIVRRLPAGVGKWPGF
jgi:hypothetical protein